MEGGPIEVVVELLGDGDDLGGDAAVVLELDGVGQGAGRLDEKLRAVAGGADEGTCAGAGVAEATFAMVLGAFAGVPAVFGAETLTST